MKLILASSSPSRTAIMKLLGYDFDIINHKYDEDKTLKGSPEEIVKNEAYEKVKSIAGRCRDSIVIGFDTVVYFNGNILYKPFDKNDAKKMLLSLQGKTHTAFTGVCVCNTKTNKYLIDFDSADVKFRKLSDKEIKTYVKEGKGMNCAGAYYDMELIKEVEGDIYTVKGIPVFKLLKMMGEIKH